MVDAHPRRVLHPHTSHPRPAGGRRRRPVPLHPPPGLCRLTADLDGIGRHLTQSFPSSRSRPRYSDTPIGNASSPKRRCSGETWPGMPTTAVAPKPLSHSSGDVARGAGSPNVQPLPKLARKFRDRCTFGARAALPTQQQVDVALEQPGHFGRLTAHPPVVDQRRSGAFGMWVVAAEHEHVTG